MQLILLLFIFFTSILTAQEKIEPDSSKVTNEIVDPSKQPLDTKTTSESKQENASTVKDAVNTVLPESYKSDQKGNTNIEHLRSILVTPEQMGALRKNKTFWLDDKLKIGFHLRPRYESRQNADFNRNTDDYTNFVGQNSQVWFLLDPSPYFAAKITIQDARLWGGNQNSGVGGDTRYALTNNAGREITPATTTTPTAEIEH